MSIAAVADNWADEQDHRVGESRDQEAGDKIGRAKLLKKKLHDARNGAVAQRPSYVTPKKPEGKRGESEAGVGEGSYLPLSTSG